MKKRAAGLLLALLLAGCASSDKPAPEPVPPAAPVAVMPEAETLLGVELTDDLSERDRGWIEDLDLLRKEYERHHIDPFFLCPREEFRWKLERLAAQVGELSDDGIYFELRAILAAMGDSHTVLSEPQSLSQRLLPMRIRFWGEKAYLHYCLEGCEQLKPYLLHEVVAVNGVDIAYLQRKAERLCSPYNSWRAKEYFSRYSDLPAFYDWAGCDYQEGYTLRVLNDNREAVDVEVPVITYEECRALIEQNAVIWPKSYRKLPHLVSTDSLAAYYEGENGGCVYLLLSEQDAGDSFEALFASVGELFQAHPACEKLVIDLRQYPGGDLNAVHHIRQNLPLLRSASIQQTYVLTSGSTASAAMYLLSLFKGELGAVTVGEPTGEFPSFFGYTGSHDSPQITLPHSGLTVKVSDKRLDFGDFTAQWSGDSVLAPLAEEYRNPDGGLYAWESTVLPDVYVSQDIEDLRLGRDSVLEWVLAQ